MAGEVDVWMAMHWRDYFADTADLDAEESGAYLHLLGHMWLQGGALPVDNERLRRLAKVSGGRWGKVWKRIGPFFTTIDNHLLTQKRLQVELGKAVELKEARKHRTEAARAKRHGGHRDVSPPVTTARPTSVTEIVTGSATEIATSPVTETPVPAPAPAPLLHELQQEKFSEGPVSGQGVRQDTAKAIASDDPKIDSEGARVLIEAAGVIRASAIALGGLRDDHGEAEWLAIQRRETAELQGLVHRFRVQPQVVAAAVAWAVADGFWRPKIADCQAFARQWKSILGAMRASPSLPSRGAAPAAAPTPPAPTTHADGDRWRTDWPTPPGFLVASGRLRKIPDRRSPPPAATATAAGGAL